MLSRFFLERPVFAWVIAIILMVAGGLAILTLPISQYPPIAPPSIAITAFYPGASAETVENSVTQIIEQKMTGFDKMLYLSASSDSSGSSRVELTFAPGTDPDLAWAQVQNKLQLAMASLPEVVQRSGIRVSKSTRNYLLMVGLISEDGSLNGDDLRDYAQSNVEKVLSRVPGVGEVEVFGSQYAMRIWLNPDKLTEYRMTIQDVILALRAYNVEVSAGQFGGMPAAEGQRLNAAVIVQSLLKTPEEFASIPVRSNLDGSVVRVRDVGRAELGTEFYGMQAYYNGKPSAVLAVRQAAGANALDTADAIRAKMNEMSEFFPAGMKVVYPYDTTPFVEVAIEEVVKTLFEAILLVFLVMYLFLGNMRATLIPTIAVPVVILGTFAVLGLFGFSINMLTMFAMVLAIGLLVDDAIVVVENVERIMSEEGISPKEATRKSMDQITSALIGIGLVLSAVFGPMAFFTGSTGVIYRQFSVTIIASMLLSVLVALILTPVLCASLLKPVAKGHEPAEGGIWLLRRPDVLQAESLLRAAYADIGAARATLFPRISLTAAVGTASSELSGLFESGSGTWSYAPQAAMPIFDTRARLALRVTKVQREIALTQYEGAIQNAFREVADALAVRGTVDHQVSAQESLVHAVAETYRLSTTRYDRGIDSYLSVLDAQRSLYAAQQRLVSLRLAKLANQVRLYAVLGGGGDSSPETTEP